VRSSLCSGVLFGLYMLFKIFSKEYINMLLTAYFLLFGIIGMCARHSTAGVLKGHAACSCGDHTGAARAHADAAQQGDSPVGIHHSLPVG
jgi:hypothetical protein